MNMDIQKFIEKKITETLPIMCAKHATNIGKEKKLRESLTSLLAEIEAKVKDMHAAHVRWSDTELAEYARGGKETCEDILEYLRPSEPKGEEK